MRVRARKYRRLRKCRAANIDGVQEMSNTDCAPVLLEKTLEYIPSARSGKYAGGGPPQIPVEVEVERNATSTINRTEKWTVLEIKFANTSIRKYFGEGGAASMGKTLIAFLSEMLQW